jgi:uncharacterized protein (TIGR03437 family)
MPKVAVFVVRYHAANRSLIATTHGRDVYRLALPRAVVSVSAARATLAGEAIVAAFGAGLAIATQVAAALPSSTELAGTRIVVYDSSGAERNAPLFFVAPTQINYQTPSGLANGLATATVRSRSGAISLRVLQLDFDKRS